MAYTCDNQEGLKKVLPASTEPKTRPILLPKTQDHLAAEQQLKDLQKKHFPDIGIVPRRQ